MKRNHSESIPTAKKQKTGENKFIENVQMSVSLEIISEFYNVSEKTFKPSKSKLRAILKKHQVATIKEIENLKLPSHFTFTKKRMETIFKYTLHGFGISLNNSQTNPLFEEKKETIENIQSLLLSYLQSSDIVSLIDKLKKEGLVLNRKYEDYKYNVEMPLNSDTLRLKTIDNLIFSSIIPPFRDSVDTTSEMELSRLYFTPILSFTSIFSDCSGGS